MTIPPDIHDILSRSRGAFVGLAIGDALGAPVEFMTSHEIRAKYGVLRDLVGGGWLRLKPGQVTDDTEMAFCIARALDARQGWDLKGIADNFAAWLRTKPVDVGDTCRRSIRNYMLKGMLETPFNQWDAGNGAAMRMAPVSLFTLGDDDLLSDCAVTQARLTHNHPLSDTACIYLGRLVHLAIQGRSKNRLRREVDRLVAEQPTFGFDTYRGLASGYVVDTMQTVFHHFFRTAGFEECVVATVNQGGDADTTGAIAGMLAGAYYGMEQVPRRWLKRLDPKVLDETTRLAERLLHLSPLFSGLAGSHGTRPLG
ncbi:ADP-ribosyl-[dinitrogen reductase] hydrolase [Geobacter sp. AOG1]|uniref:ADP-ribosyl-[dinitrogen reductase] hydrolase n=1 Tax=Geobacter sp. AOG1 TaxID=1566346 RepID=UPI001CC81AFC|nr:ADP-ribosyl-[dinitrogen reductase] hydrolase [Geobacter sp. AOG1]